MSRSASSPFAFVAGLNPKYFMNAAKIGSLDSSIGIIEVEAWRRRGLGHDQQVQRGRFVHASHLEVLCSVHLCRRVDCGNDVV